MDYFCDSVPFPNVYPYMIAMNFVHE